MSAHLIRDYEFFRRPDNTIGIKDRVTKLHDPAMSHNERYIYAATQNDMRTELLRSFDDKITPDVFTRANLTSVFDSWVIPTDIFTGKGLTNWMLVDGDAEKTLSARMVGLAAIINFKGVTDPAEVSRFRMLALNNMSSRLPDGFAAHLKQVGGGSEQYRDNLFKALQKQDFVKFMVSDAGSEQLNAAFRNLYVSDLRSRYGMGTAQIKELNEKIGTEVFARISEGKYQIKDGVLTIDNGNGQFVPIQDYTAGMATMHGFENKLDLMAKANPATKGLVDHLKTADNQMLRYSLAAAYETSEPFRTAFDKIMAGENPDMSPAQLQKVFADPDFGPASAQLLQKIAAEADKENGIGMAHFDAIAAKVLSGDKDAATRAFASVGIDAAAAKAAVTGTDNSYSSMFNGISKFLEKDLGIPKELHAGLAIGVTGFVGSLLAGNMLNGTLGKIGMIVSLGVIAYQFLPDQYKQDVDRVLASAQSELKSALA